MARQGVVNFEMEASALLVLAELAGCRAGVVCTAYAQRVSGAFVDGEQRERAEAACIETGLEAFSLLAEMDEAVTSRGAVHWRPSLWVAERGILSVAQAWSRGERPRSHTQKVTE